MALHIVTRETSAFIFSRLPAPKRRALSHGRLLFLEKLDAYSIPEKFWWRAMYCIEYFENFISDAFIISSYPEDLSWRNFGKTHSANLTGIVYWKGVIYIIDVRSKCRFKVHNVPIIWWYNGNVFSIRNRCSAHTESASCNIRSNFTKCKFLSAPDTAFLHSTIIFPLPVSLPFARRRRRRNWKFPSWSLSAVKKWGRGRRHS